MRSPFAQLLERGVELVSIVTFSAGRTRSASTQWRGASRHSDPAADELMLSAYLDTYPQGG